MKKKFILAGSIIGICVLIVAAVLFFTRTNVQASQAPNLETCESLQYNSENAINLVFMAEKETAKEYMNYLFQYPPFKETQNNFNIYLIDNEVYKPQCDLYRGIAIYCYSRELVQKSASCPNDYIIVLEEQPRSIRSSAYKNVMSLNTNVPKTVMLHELGHAIAFFAEEYLAEGASIPRKAQNCVTDCEDFSGLNQDCLQECTTSSHYRSIGEGLMRTLYPETITYGTFDESIMLEQIIGQSKESSNRITGSVIAQTTIDCENQKYKLIEGKIDENNELQITRTSIQQGCASGFGIGDTEIKLIDESGRVIREESSNLNTVFTTDDNVEGITSPPFDYKGDTFIQVSEESSTVEIINNGKTLNLNMENTGANTCRL